MATLLASDVHVPRFDLSLQTGSLWVAPRSLDLRRSGVRSPDGRTDGRSDKKQSGTEWKRESASGRACAARVATLGRRAGGREQSRADRSEACFIFARGREVLWPPKEGSQGT